VSVPARVGILGGTFDPIHLGHLEAAQAARQALSLDHVLLMPSRTPPHRTTEPRASAFHRFAMTALAIGGADGMVASDLELLRDGPSYTALTLAALHREGLTASQLFFVTGSDAFAEIGTWYDYPRFLGLANFAVISRPGTRVTELPPDPQPLAPEASTSVLFVDAATPDVSSTEIRRRLGDGERIDGLVPAGVAAHIRRHRLYASAPVAAIP
jgi:nicotinate-nucleotide adenylyltransferase